MKTMSMTIFHVLATEHQCFHGKSIMPHIHCLLKNHRVHACWPVIFQSNSVQLFIGCCCNLY